MPPAPGRDPADRTDSRLQVAIERLRRGDASARNELLAHTRRRLERMTRKLLRGANGFPVVRRWEQTDDVLQQSMLRLDRTLAQEPINSVRHFLALAALNIRWELKDLHRHYVGKHGLHANHQTDRMPSRDGGEDRQRKIVADAVAPPDRVEAWNAYLDGIDHLTDEQREILDAIFIHGLTQQEAADVMGMPLRTFKRRWAEIKLLLQGTLRNPGAAHDGSRPATPP